MPAFLVSWLRVLLPDHAELQPATLNKAWFLRLVRLVGLSWACLRVPWCAPQVHTLSSSVTIPRWALLAHQTPTKCRPCLFLSLFALNWDFIACVLWEQLRDEIAGEDREARELLGRPVSASREYAETERTAELYLVVLTPTSTAGELTPELGSHRPAFCTSWALFSQYVQITVQVPVTHSWLTGLIFYMQLLFLC